MNKFIIFATLMVSAVVAQQDGYNKAPTYSAPAAPAASAGYGKTEEYAPMPYSFDWAVKDEESKNDYGHNEKSDGKVVTGSYRVALPDGRIQIVTYTADENGYVADVKYEGEAKYPEPSQYQSANNKPSY